MASFDLVRGRNAMEGVEMGASKTGRGGTLARTQTVGVRLDDKLRYFAELAARKQHRTLSSYVEWAVRESVASVPLNLSPSGGDAVTTVASEAERLWHTEPAHRFALLATSYPDLLSHHEQLLWTLVRRTSRFWKVPPEDGHSGGVLDYDELRGFWLLLNAVARREKDERLLTAPAKK